MKVYTILALSFCLLSGMVSAVRGFTLRDQFGTPHTVSFPSRAVTVLAFANRDGSKQMDDWMRPLAQRYARRLDIQGVAVLQGVPALFHGFARMMIRNSVPQPVLLDWDGSSASNYPTPIGQAGIYVLTTNGAVAHTESGAVTGEKLTNCCRAIDALLAR